RMIQSMLRVLPLVILLSGCSWIPFMGKKEEQRFKDTGRDDIASLIANLPEVDVPTAAVAARPTQAEVMAAYERVYGLIPDVSDNHSVGKRLADLKMTVGEDLDIAGEENPYASAVELYESLLLNSEGEGKDEIIYQLARAHDVGGNTDQAVAYLNRLIGEYPDSKYIVEARFRRAEIAFSRESYRDASRDYGFVVDVGDSSPYYLNASYMRGWSLFKLSDLDEGLASFFSVIDMLVPEGADGAASATDDELLKDSFRVVTLALGYLDGADTLAEQMAALGKPHWQYLAYETLADDYLNDERYLDSVATWQRFIEENSLDGRAPSAHIGMIETLTRADFPAEIRPKKEEFVKRYGISSEFWVVHDQDTRASYQETLKEYLGELAQVAHGEAQASGKQLDYLAAAGWYEELVATFPEDPATAEYLFLLGEVYTEAAEHGKAVAAYQRVVREFSDFEKAHEAGYAAILGYDELVASSPAAELELWKRLKIDAQIEFALLFPDDERAPAVQTAAADSLFDLQQYQQAVDLAQNLMVMFPNLEPEHEKTALLILGHGWFELQDFATAENAYHRLLGFELAADKQSNVEERLLASVFKQGEASEAAGAPDDAIYHYLRLGEIDHDAELAIQGHFDAIAVVEGLGRTGEAAALLADFRGRYPNHELGRDTSKRLAGMYEQTEDWSGAAAEYVELSRSAEESDVRRQSAYRAAELYLQLGDERNAIEYFSSYAHTYHEPMDLRLEAIQNLDEIYQRNGDPDKRRFWLEKKIEVYRAMGGNPTQRATYLAAEAELVFAEDERLRFDAVRLSNPLPESLKRKQTALKRTLKAFERVADYKVAGFSTASTFHIADLYAALSAEIMRSDRPDGLSALELEQYEILLEEQAFPFEEQAIGLHEINMRRSWEGTYDDWVKKSFAELGRLMPARFDKHEIEIAYVEAIH
ncbi:MAG: tetratricopeptide repeat protein, partial [Gammaproteobacteria bacterium]|nr:tetratricopeptide repeat protein [Gammaproteobacteria bacterium]